MRSPARHGPSPRPFPRFAGRGGGMHGHPLAGRLTPMPHLPPARFARARRDLTRSSRLYLLSRLTSDNCSVCEAAVSVALRAYWARLSCVEASMTSASPSLLMTLVSSVFC